MLRPFLPLSLVLILPVSAKDTVLTDFEGSDFGVWKTTGDAFGNGPAQGAINGQMNVGGFEGKGFASSFHGGDDATGKLVSPPFKLEGKYLNFLIGGGGFAGETCMNLISNGAVVRTATGRNVTPGGSEGLDWESWDLSGLTGKMVTLEIIDKRKGGWGHISIDQIVQSDEPKVFEAKKEITINQRYLIWPVSLDRSQRRTFMMNVDGELLCYSGICLSGKPDFWTFTDLANYQGKKLTVTAKLPYDLSGAWDQVKISDTYPGADELYREALRPQYHFTSRRGWLNDPNGLVYDKGFWHLFYQHNPYNHFWDNMHWGHAVSKDLLHWQEGPDALMPDKEGYMYSGSAVMVPKGKGPAKSDNAMALIYTAEGSHSFIPGGQATQAIAISEDGGKTFKKFPGNPVLPNAVGGNRDPKVFWHEPSKHWIMPLYYDGDHYGLYNSTDLVKWTKTGDYHIPGNGECPDLYELPVEGNPEETRWVAWGANGRYLLGKFDGRDFKPDGAPLQHYFGAAYAGQTYSNAPDNRRVHVGWMRDEGPAMGGMPFNLQMTVPMDFTLRHDTDGSLRLWAEPSKELAALRADSKEWKDLTWQPGSEDPLAVMKDGHFEVDAVIDASSPAASFGFQVCEEFPAVWKKADQSFTDMVGVQAPVDGKVHVKMFVDTVSMEVFVNGSYVARYLRQKPGAQPVKIFAEGGAVRFDSLSIHRMNSVWKQPS